jgi:hypothetical protein
VAPFRIELLKSFTGNRGVLSNAAEHLGPRSLGVLGASVPNENLTPRGIPRLLIKDLINPSGPDTPHGKAPQQRPKSTD